MMPVFPRAALVTLLLASPSACKQESATLSTPLKIVDVDCDDEFLRGLEAAVHKTQPEGIVFETRDLEGAEDLAFVSGPSREALTTYSRTLPPPGAPAGFIFVYEDQNGRERQPWRMYCVEAEGLTLHRVAELQRNPDSVKLTLEAADAQALAAFTAERIGRPIAFVIGDDALAVPVVHEQISQSVTLNGPRAVAALK
jgi:hypothetical protein